MKKNYSEAIKKYGLLTSSLALAGTKIANAQIIYTDVDPDSTIGTNQSMEIDLNNDGQMDVRLFQEINGGYTYAAIGMPYGAGQLQMISASWYPSALDAGTDIDSTNSYWKFYSGALSGYSYFGGSFGEFGGAGDKYIGIRFDVGGEFHYGWILVNVASGGSSITLKSYAVEESPGKKITAGNTVLSVEDDVAVKVSASPNPTTGTVNFTGADVISVKVYDTLGNLVVESSESSVDLSSYSAGVYVALVETTAGVVSKRITKE